MAPICSCISRNLRRRRGFAVLTSPRSTVPTEGSTGEFERYISRGSSASTAWRPRRLAPLSGRANTSRVPPVSLLRPGIVRSLLCFHRHETSRSAEISSSRPRRYRWPRLPRKMPRPMRTQRKRSSTSAPSAPPRRWKDLRTRPPSTRPLEAVAAAGGGTLVFPGRHLRVLHHPPQVKCRPPYLSRGCTHPGRRFAPPR